MDTNPVFEVNQLLSEKNIFPSVSIIFPMDLSQAQYNYNKDKLKLVVKRVQKYLAKEFPATISKPLIVKLIKVYNEVDFKVLSKGLAIYISQNHEKLFRFSFTVKEKVIIDKSFQIRDLLFAAKYNIEYFILLISSNENKLFRGFDKSFKEIDFVDAPKNIKEWKIDLHTKVGNFSDAHSINDITLEKYLRDIDRSLSNILRVNALPIVIACVGEIADKYKKISKNSDLVLGYIEGNFEHASVSEIVNKTIPVLEEKSIKEQEKYLDLLMDAIGMNTFASGITDVWKASMENRSRILLVEKNYSCPAKFGISKFTLITKDVDANDIYSIKDAVDDLIEIVLKRGGDVVFVEDDTLIEHNHIALITNSRI